jgi:tetraacyldisaccharide 4'-kinase
MSQPSLWRRLLFPLIPLYGLALVFRDFRLMLGFETVRQLRFPVISIGNLSTGGSGKTPLTVALARALIGRGLRVDVLSRGYGRESQFAARVREKGTAEEFGDEPLLIVHEAVVPVYVAPQRYDAGVLAEADADAERAAWKKEMARRKAEAEKNPPAPVSPEPARADKPAVKPAGSGEKPAAEPVPSEPAKPEEPPPPPPPSLAVHLLDDGFQHRQLARDVNILMLNWQDWQDWLLPAGNLREPADAIHRASVLAIPANEPDLEIALHLWGWSGPIWRLNRKMDIPPITGPVAAFCGIARPEQFFDGLRDAGLEVVLPLAFPDHFTYSSAVLQELVAQARDKEVQSIITTRKDLLRLGKLISIFPTSLPLVAARLRVEIESHAAAIDWLVDRVTPKPKR